MAVHAQAEILRDLLPGPISAQWPEGERFVFAIAHGSMSVEFYAPVGQDFQTPHEQDELYFIHSGQGIFVLGDDQYFCKAGSVFFVPAYREHRFVEFSEDFSTWVVFWGPKGGESQSP